MKKILLSMACLMAVLALSAQSTAKKFVLNLTADGESNLTCYLPQNPSGRAVVDCPGGGYSHLALNHEGYDWAEYFNKQGIAFFVLKYRMPHGRHTVPMEDACKAMRTVRDSASVWNINREDVGIMGFSAGFFCQHSGRIRCSPQLLHLVLSCHLDETKEGTWWLQL